MKIGFIGVGNMGSAMLKGVASQMPSESLMFTDVNKDLMLEIEAATGVQAMASIGEVIQACELIVLAVKPQYMHEVLDIARSYLMPRHILLSIAPGITIDKIKDMTLVEQRVVRSMPNTPALVLEGMSAYTFSADSFTEEEKDFVKDFFCSFGRAVEINEQTMDQVVPISGSSPAYFFLMLEAMADGAVLTGMPRKQAYEMAAQSMLGAAKMVLETGDHPGVLKDAVCSPGGTTIEAVKVLEAHGFRGSIIAAMEACYNKTKRFSRGQNE